MNLPTKKLYLEGIVPDHNWTREQWEALANLLRGSHCSAGHPGDMGHWVEYPVMDGGEPCLARVYPGDIVVIDETNAVRVYKLTDFKDAT